MGVCGLVSFVRYESGLTQLVTWRLWTGTIRSLVMELRKPRASGQGSRKVQLLEFHCISFESEDTPSSLRYGVCVSVIDFLDAEMGLHKPGALSGS
jgi:hypothetical protein